MIRWHNQVNKKAYGVEWSPIDNVEKTELENGKVKTRRINTESKKQYSFNLYFSKAEYFLFAEWWKSELKDGALSFEFPNLEGLDENTEYEMVEPYSASWQNYKEVSMVVREC